MGRRQEAACRENPQGQAELEAEAKVAAEAKLKAKAEAAERREAEGRRKPGRQAAPPSTEKLWGGRRRSWHLHRPYELMEVTPWPKSMISAEA